MRVRRLPISCSSSAWRSKGSVEWTWPRRFGAAHIEWGVDVDGDGRPEALMIRYCSDDPKQVECFEATSHALYRRAGRRWRKVFVFEPVS